MATMWPHWLHFQRPPGSQSLASMTALPVAAPSMRAPSPSNEIQPPLALPQVVMARPTGVGRALATYALPIEGRDEWVAAAKRFA